MGITVLIARYLGEKKEQSIGQVIGGGTVVFALISAVLFSMVGYFNGNDKTVWVMVQGLVQTLLVRLPMTYIVSIQPNASLTMIGLAAPTSTVVGDYPECLLLPVSGTQGKESGLNGSPALFQTRKAW